MTRNMVEAKVSVKGIRPMLWHRFTEHSIPLEKQERTGVAGNDPEEWRRTGLFTNEGQLYLESTYIFAAIREGAKFTKRGKSSLMGQVSATLQVLDNTVPVDRWFPGYPNGHPFDVAMVDVPPRDPSLPVYLDVRSVRNPSTKARNVRYRVAASPGWTCEFTLMWDKTVINRTELEAIIIDAGQLVGLGNGRAIGMGRFEVLSFEVKES